MGNSKKQLHLNEEISLSTGSMGWSWSTLLENNILVSLGDLSSALIVCGFGDTVKIPWPSLTRGCHMTHALSLGLSSGTFVPRTVILEEIAAQPQRDASIQLQSPRGTVHQDLLPVCQEITRIGSTLPPLKGFFFW